MSERPQSTYPPRLPRSVKADVERRARADAVSVDQRVATAVAEKLAVMNTAAFFAERRDKADFAAFDRIMRRGSGETPQPEDTLGQHRLGRFPLRLAWVTSPPCP